MTGKHLPLKFIFVALLIVLSVGSFFWGNGLVYGPDIAGGYAMVYRVENDNNDPFLIEQVIGILKKRVDPTGLASIEWRPLKNNSFEVRMPAASKKSREFGKAYFDVREKLLEHNITRANIRTLQGMTQQERDKELSARLRNDKGEVDKDQIKDIETLLKDIAELDTKEKALVDLNKTFEKDKSNSKKTIAAQQKQQQGAKDAIKIASEKYMGTWKQVLQGNINVNTLDSILRGYNYAIAQGNKVDKKNALADYNARVVEFCDEHPVWQAGIKNVAALYQKWADVRRPLEDPSDLKNMIQKAGILEFRIAPTPRENQEQTDNTLTKEQVGVYEDLLDDEGPKALQAQGKDYAWYAVYHEDGGEGLITKDYHGQTYVLLSNKPGEKLVRPGLGQPEWKLSSASVGSDQYGGAAVNFSLDSAGASQFAFLTKNNLKKPMAILLDDEMYSAPTIQSMISSKGEITGKFTYEEVKKLAQTLAAGSLRGKIDPNPISETAFSAALGEVNIEKGKRAAVIGLIAVAAFMLVYYLLCGAIANIALMLNIILIVGAMSIFRAVLTLPGIAGIILTIGIAVDANVLIFERLREEQAAGFGVKQALKNAYERAFSAIFDANITTLLICLFLFVVFDQIGMQEVRGFAITLGFGVVFSMFTSLIVTRWVFEVLLGAKIISKPLHMLRLVPKVSVKWISKRYFFWFISLVLIVTGIVSLVWQGKNILGIEFSSGTQAVMKFQSDALVDGKLPNDDLVRTKIEAMAIQMRDTTTDENQRKNLDKLIATARVETQINENNVRDFLKLYGNDKGVVTLEDWKKKNKSVEFFNLIDTNEADKGVLTKDELDKNLPQPSYQISTTAGSLIVRKVINDSLGTSLQTRTKCVFDLAKNKNIPDLGVVLNSSGKTFITPDYREGVKSSYRDELIDHEGGVMFVVENVKPVITVLDLKERIRDMRRKSDFGQQAGNSFDVVGLKSAGNDSFSAFVVLASPVDLDKLKTPQEKDAFANAELLLLTQAINSEEMMDIRSFDPAIAGQTAQLAIVAVILSWLAIVGYLWLRFGSIRWGLAAVVCLVHDVIIVVGMIAVSGWVAGTSVGNALGISSFKIDLAMVAALLTVIGYSVNDTIVVFDRIRENRGKLKTITAPVINTSINQTLPRTLLTSFTTFMVVLIMYIWGGPGIKPFSYALLIGIIFGTYSSIAIASPLLLGFKEALVVKDDEVVSEDEFLEEQTS